MIFKNFTNGTYQPGQTLLEVDGSCELCSMWLRGGQLSQLDIYVDDVKYRTSMENCNGRLVIATGDPVFIELYKTSPLKELKLFYAVLKYATGQCIRYTHSINMDKENVYVPQWVSSEFGTVGETDNPMPLKPIQAKRSIKVTVSDNLTGPISVTSNENFVGVRTFKE